MKLTVIRLTALAFVLLDTGACNSSSSPAVGTSSGTDANRRHAASSQIILGDEDALPTVQFGDTLDFVLPGAQAGEAYFVAFKNTTPCDHGQMLLRGDATTHPSCVVGKQKKKNRVYHFTYGTELLGQNPITVVVDSIVRCFPCN